MSNFRIGILGPPERAAVWEQYLRPHASVSEVIISNQLPAIGQVDACIVLEENPTRLDMAYQVVRSGFHAFVVGKLPTDRELVERLFHTSEESRTRLQFSNWAFFNPATQWMMSHIKKPHMLHFQRELHFAAYRESKSSYENMWMEDLALALKWVDSHVHRVDVNRVPLNSEEQVSMQFFIRFDNGAVFTLFTNIVAQENRHTRFASDRTHAAESDVIGRKARIIRLDNHVTPLSEPRQFAREEPAKIAVAQFLKSLQMGTATAYSGYDALRFTSVLSTIRDAIYR